MAILPNIFNPEFYNGPMAGVLGNLPGYMTQPGQSQGFPGAPGMPTDMSGSRAPQAPPGAPMDIQPPQAPQGGGFMGGLSNGLANNSNMLMAMGAALMGGKGMGGALESGMMGGQLDQRNRTTNQTRQALIKQGLSPEMAEIVAGNPALMSAVMQQKMGLTGGTDDIKEFEYAKKQGFTGNLQEWMQRKRAGAGEYGLQGIWGVGPDGKPALVQLGKSGDAIQSKLPDGFTPAKDPIKVDAGTHFVLLDPQTRQPITTIPKNIEGKEAAEEIGKARGQAQVALPNVVANAEQTLKIIQDIKNDPYRQRGTGGSSIFNAIPATGGFDFAQKVEQLKGKAFLEAFQSLKGGGAITEIEGKKAENAIARLNVAQSEGAFLEAINDLEAVVTAGIGRAKARAQPGSAAPAAVPAVTGAPNLKQKYGLE
jgi:hypothetical protein